MIALPGDPGNGLHVGELPDDVQVDIAYAGSCTAGKKEDMDMYARVFREALDVGRHVAPHVRCYIQCGSRDVFESRTRDEVTISAINRNFPGRSGTLVSRRIRLSSPPRPAFRFPLPASHAR